MHANPPEKIVPTLGLAIGRVLDLEPILAILTIHSGLALGDNSFEVPSADFRKQFLSCALDMLGIQQTGTVAQPERGASLLRVRPSVARWRGPEAEAPCRTKEATRATRPGREVSEAALRAAHRAAREEPFRRNLRS